MNNYENTAKVVRVVDGDSIIVDIDLGYNVKHTTSMRLAGIDTPETRGKTIPEREAAQAVTYYVNQLVDIGRHYDKTCGGRGDLVLSCESTAKPKFAGRSVGLLNFDMLNAADTDLSAHLLSRGLCRPYLGAKRQPWTERTLKRITRNADACVVRLNQLVIDSVNPDIGWIRDDTDLHNALAAVFDKRVTKPISIKVQPASIYDS